MEAGNGAQRSDRINQCTIRSLRVATLPAFVCIPKIKGHKTIVTGDYRHFALAERNSNQIFTHPMPHDHVLHRFVYSGIIARCL